MNYNRIGILFFLFLLLGAYVYFFEIGRGEKVEQVVQEEKIFYMVSEDVLEIIVKKEKQSVLLENIDGHWRMMKPVEVAVSKSKIFDLLSIFKYGIVREIDTNSPDLKLYGLDNPSYEFGFKVKGNDSFQVLQIGNNSPGSLGCYAKVKDQPRVLLIGLSYKQELERGLDYFNQAMDSN